MAKLRSGKNTEGDNDPIKNQMNHGGMKKKAVSKNVGKKMAKGKVTDTSANQAVGKSSHSQSLEVGQSSSINPQAPISEPVVILTSEDEQRAKELAYGAFVRSLTNHLGGNSEARSSAAARQSVADHDEMESLMNYEKNKKKPNISQEGFFLHMNRYDPSSN